MQYPEVEKFKRDVTAELEKQLEELENQLANSLTTRLADDDKMKNEKKEAHIDDIGSSLSVPTPNVSSAPTFESLRRQMQENAKKAVQDAKTMDAMRRKGKLDAKEGEKLQQIVDARRAEEPMRKAMKAEVPKLTINAPSPETKKATGAVTFASLRKRMQEQANVKRVSSMDSSPDSSERTMSLPSPSLDVDSLEHNLNGFDQNGGMIPTLREDTFPESSDSIFTRPASSTMASSAPYSIDPLLDAVDSDDDEANSLAIEPDLFDAPGSRRLYKVRTSAPTIGTKGSPRRPQSALTATGSPGKRLRTDPGTASISLGTPTAAASSTSMRTSKTRSTPASARDTHTPGRPMNPLLRAAEAINRSHGAGAEEDAKTVYLKLLGNEQRASMAATMEKMFKAGLKDDRRESAARKYRQMHADANHALIGTLDGDNTLDSLDQLVQEELEAAAMLPTSSIRQFVLAIEAALYNAYLPATPVAQDSAAKESESDTESMKVDPESDSIVPHGVVKEEASSASSSILADPSVSHAVPSTLTIAPTRVRAKPNRTPRAPTASPTAVTPSAPGSAPGSASSAATTSSSTESELGHGYRERGRLLLRALRASGHTRFRLDVLSGTIGPRQLVSMDPELLATPAEREELQRLREEAALHADLDSGVVDSEGASLVPELVCRGCHQKKCVFRLVVGGGVRDIRKAEVWGSKDLSEVETTKFRCTNCGKEWTEG